MPLSDENLSVGRVDFSNSLTVEEVDLLAADPELTILQTSAPVESETWDLLNERLFSERPDVELRVYGFYSKECNLSFLPRLENVRRFSADCLMRARGVEHVASLKNLTSLSVGIYALDSFDFLENVPQNLTELSLGVTKSKRPRLTPLARFSQLRRLFLAGQQKDIDVVSELHLIGVLELFSISVDGLDFLNGLIRLWSLHIQLGGTNNLAALKGREGIKYLNLCQVRGLDDISVVSTLTGLQFLSLRSLGKIRAIPDLSQLCALRRVHLDSMKGLSNIRALAGAPALEELLHTCAQGREPEDYKALLQSKTLKRLLVGFGSERKNKVLSDLATQAGIEPYESSDFQFA
jgi:hypothetical protein